MDEPLYVVRYAALRWLTTANHELFIWDNRFASVRGDTLKSTVDDARLDLAIYGSFTRRQATARMQELTAERISNAVKLSESELLMQAPDNVMFETDAITTARLTKRFGICKLSVALDDGRKLTWRWMNLAMCGRYEEVAPVLRRTIGPRLTAR